MSHPLVVHCKRDTYDVYVGRPSKWGNPFKLSAGASRLEVIERYRKYLNANPSLIADAKRELKGKVLGCWCAPKDCHADVLAEVANSEDERIRNDNQGFTEAIR